MKVSFNWLKQYIPTEVDLSEMVEILTNTGLEVGSVAKFEPYSGGLEGLVVGEVKSVEKHPDADRLSVTKVDIGAEENSNIVCGAPNVEKGQKVVVAVPGTTLHPIKGDPFKIKKGKIRGIVSEGMICAEDEIGLGEDHDGIMVLDKKAKKGQSLRSFLNIQEDHTIEIDLTPNRTDAISHFGVARDYLAVKNLESGLEKTRLNTPDVSDFKVDNNDVPIKVRVEDREACPRYSGVSMNNISVGPSPDWLKERLLAIGLNPINNVVDAANYVMYETGQPMHTFDVDAITGNTVVIKKLSNGTTFKTLDEKERKLSQNDLMICNQKEGMCIAGVFGGISSGVTEKTTSIFIESAYFEPSGIRKTAKGHGLSTDASYRYERGANIDATIYALKRLALLLKEVAGGKVSSEIVDVYPIKIEQVEVGLRWSYLKSVAGKEILRDDVRNILGSLDIDILIEENDILKLRIPGYRTDVTREIDVVEEILRIYGYNNIDLPESMLSSFSYRQEIDRAKVYNQVADYLSANGYREVMNNSLTSSEKLLDKKDLVHVMNPLSNELNVMRNTMLIGGLETIAFNRNRQIEDQHIYELGTVYKQIGDDKYSESIRLGIWVCGNNVNESWQEKQRPSNFYDIKEITDGVMKLLGLKNLSFKEESIDGFEYGLIYSEGKNALAKIGKVSTKTLNSFEIEDDVYYAEIMWDEVLNAAKNVKIKFTPIPKFPSMRRDLALLIDTAVEYNTIESIAKEVGQKILKKINLFDVYQGKGVEEGKKSYGVSFVFQDPDKTLTDKHIDKVMDKLVSRLKSEIGADLR